MATPKTCQLSDRFGNVFKYGNAGDFWFPPFAVGANTDYRSHVRQIRDIEIRNDDVIIGSFPKCGLHWTEEIVSMLRASTSSYDRGSRDMVFMDYAPIETTNAHPSPRILATHVPFRHFPKQALEKGTKIIHLVRNPKDVLVSFFNHLRSNRIGPTYTGTFEQFITHSLECGFYYGDIFDHFMEWQDGIEANPQTKVFVSVFEELKKNPISHIQKLNDYLETNCSEETCQDIAAACEFSKLKAYKDTTKPPVLDESSVNPKFSFYRKGIVGDWENWFSPDLLKLYEEEFANRMEGYKREFM